MNLDKVFTLYKAALLAHIGTKTTESRFHEKSEEFYGILFNVFHAVSEKRQDTGEDSPVDCEDAASTSLSALKEALKEVESAIASKNSVGTDNLLRWLADELESAIGDAKAFVYEEEEEYAEESKPEAKKTLTKK